MLQEGKVLPCVFTLYMNPVIPALYVMPHLFRGLRAVILANKGECSSAAVSTSCQILSLFQLHVASRDGRNRCGASLAQSTKQKGVSSPKINSGLYLVSRSQDS